MVGKFLDRVARKRHDLGIAPADPIADELISHKGIYVETSHRSLLLWYAGFRDGSVLTIVEEGLGPHYYDGGYYNTLARLMCLFGPTAVHGGSDYDSWGMGVGAGGLIEQKIHEETNPTDIRIKSAQTLLNVQILNSVAFESIIGMMTTPTPVAPEDYISAGLPFFKEYLELKSEGSPGPRGFTNFSTVQELDAA